jgi:hypothetical protein
MSDRPSDPAELEPDAPQGSVFGNLPDSRPGGRSPRRDSGSKPRLAAAKPRATAAKRTAKPKAKATAAKPAPRARPRPASPPPERPAAEPESGGGLEGIAWAGVATVAEVATVGVRLLSKSIEALRGNSEKS